MNEICSDIPLPQNWSVYIGENGRKVFVDHVNQTTSWIDPRDNLIKPQSFSDCMGDELPVGWERAYNESIGEYFIDHNTGINQLEDPREQWRKMQESMIHHYLQSAKESIQAKEQIVQLKEERSSLANQELNHLLYVLQKIEHRHLKNSQSNLGSKNCLTTASSSSSLYTKYDPDLLKAEIEVAKRRVAKLKHEALCARRDLNQKQLGVETLARIEKGIVERTEGYSTNEKYLLEDQLLDLKQLSLSIEQEKGQLINQISELYQDLQQSSAHQSSSQLDCPHDKASSSSQTDSLECILNGNRMAALARARLRYTELKRLLCLFHQRLAALNEKMIPVFSGELELSGDQILLIREKEQLLRELKLVCGGGATETATATPAPPDDQRARLMEKMYELEDDLRQVLRLSKEEMSERSKIVLQKEQLEREIHQTGLSLVKLEQQLKSLSASTLSTSSLSTTTTTSSTTNNNSCTSLASLGDANNFSSGQNEMRGGDGETFPSTSSAAAVRMFDEVRRRVEQLIGRCDQVPSVSVSVDAKAVANVAALPCDLVVLREDSVGSTNRSISAAVSDESVAGDSGVGGGGGNASGAATVPAAPQIMASLNYDPHSSLLCVTIERCRNLSRLWIGQQQQQAANEDSVPLVEAVQIRGSLLPGDFNFRTDWVSASIENNQESLDRPAFKKSFEVSLQLRAVCEKVLQLFVFIKRRQPGPTEVECVGEAQLNLAEFNQRMMRSQWCNVLGWQFLRPPKNSENATPISSNLAGAFSQRMLNTLKEESSDESTIIPSQTSTLSRNLESELLNKTSKLSKPYSATSSSYCLTLTVNDDEETSSTFETVLPNLTDCKVETCEKETNTDLFATIRATKSFAENKTKPSESDSSWFTMRKLNRSDSDTSVAIQKKEPFKRNGMERRSLRWKKPSSISVLKKALFAQKPASFENNQDNHNHHYHNNTIKPRFRTSIDIDLDLKTTEHSIARKKDDIEVLKEIRTQLEQCKLSGTKPVDILPSTVPTLQRVLNLAEQKKKLTSVICNDTNDEPSQKSYFYSKNERNNVQVERRAQHFIKKAAKQVQKLNETKQQTPPPVAALHFQKKINALVSSPPSSVNVVRVKNNF